MKILYFFEETDSYMHQWQRQHIFDELARSGLQIEVFNPLGFSSIVDANIELCAYLKQNRFDLFMSSASSKVLLPETIKEVSRFDLPTLLICFDNLHAPFMHKEIAPFFNVVWLTSNETHAMFESWGCKNIIFQPYAANPFGFVPVKGERHDAVSFVGSPYGSRVNKINELTQSSVPVKLFSNYNRLSSDSHLEQQAVDYFELLEKTLDLLRFRIGRKVLRGALINKVFGYSSVGLENNPYLECLPAVSFEEMQSIYSQSALSLNVIELRNTYVLKSPIYKLHLRTFEIPMCGGISFSSYSQELSEYFEEDKEIVFYRSKEEFISKAKFYTSKRTDLLTRKMKLAARKRAESDHTWMTRFNRVLNNL